MNLRDLRFALRRLLRAPGFSLTVLLLLGVALGANACVFSVIYGLLYKPLPFPQAEHLVTLDTRFTSLNLNFNLGVSAPYLQSIATQSKTLTNVVAYKDNLVEMHDDSGDAGNLRAASVEPELFGLLGTGVVAGRLLNDEDAREGAAPVTMISFDVWQNRYAGAATAVGQSLRLDGRDYRIVGVLPRGFAFPKADAQLWTPLIFDAASRSVDKAGNFQDWYVIARLQPGSTAADASGEIMRIAQNSDGLKEILHVTGFQIAVKPIRSLWISERESSLQLMLLAVAMVLLVTAANVCNLYIARLLMRRHESALLEALGASPWRQLRQTVGETLALAAGAALVALALLPAGLALLGQFDLLPANAPQRIGIDAATLTFIGVLALAVATLMTLAAAVLQRRNINETLKQGGTRQTSGRRAQRARQALIVAQIALTATLLVGTGLLLRSSQKLLNEDVGFDRDHLLMTAINFKIDPHVDKATIERGRVNERAILERVRALPGVTAVGVGNLAPFGNGESAANFLPDGMVEPDEQKQPTARDARVNHDYFSALGVALTKGRAFTEQETHDEAPVAIVDADFVQHYCGGRDPIGSHFKIGMPDQKDMRELTIIGVAATIKQRSLDERVQKSTIYLPSETPPDPMLLLRSANDPTMLAEPLRQVIHELAPQARIADTVSMREWIAKTVQDRLRLNTLLELLGGMALALAAVGLYAVLAYTVRARALEFGVRMALGADAARILRDVLGHGVALVGGGLLLGLPLAYVLAQLLGSRLYHVSALDPLTLLGVAALLATIGLGACWWPARSASRVDPINALRAE